MRSVGGVWMGVRRQMRSVGGVGTGVRRQMRSVGGVWTGNALSGTLVVRLSLIALLVRAVFIVIVDGDGSNDIDDRYGIGVGGGSSIFVVDHQ
ncbi:hypothetical protein Pcinc_043698 [Petrolisthes cinctipes]|uniref:Uncharacterized protein n=1 Tax=Petrolisthes cinctipes TaxID=88211 RepID=A0AAE1EFW4_PETCI|nr:hypothetical protein Pcinc_043698 [Petrolisthes cinctipes]